jgi:hypothetical protein
MTLQQHYMLVVNKAAIAAAAASTCAAIEAGATYQHFRCFWHAEHSLNIFISLILLYWFHGNSNKLPCTRALHWVCSMPGC